MKNKNFTREENKLKKNVKVTTWVKWPGRFLQKDRNKKEDKELQSKTIYVLYDFNDFKSPPLQKIITRTKRKISKTSTQFETTRAEENTFICWSTNVWKLKMSSHYPFIFDESMLKKIFFLNLKLGTK